MFSKNAYNMFPPHGSPSSHPRTSASDFFLHHHDILSSHHFLYNQDVAAGLNGDPSAMAAASPCTAKASKKDRHSKINTAQGPRDRRVRLSIGVARKFFDLQEILGFDKPSKTLEWLLTKSETAINDVEQMREKASTDAAAANSSECEVDSAEAFQNNGTDLKQKFKGANLEKESRAKARARARERTREKMCIKKQLNETRNVNDFQFMNNQLEFRKISGSSNINVGVGFHHQNYEAANEDLIEESIVIKRKVKQYPSNSIVGFQQNLIISSSNYGIPTPYNNNAAAAAAASDNWDNICAILDQHKFINSTSNN